MDEGAEHHRAHLTSALTALHHVVEAHPRLAALLAAQPALAPLLHCLEPICRQVWQWPLPSIASHMCEFASSWTCVGASTCAPGPCMPTGSMLSEGRLTDRTGLFPGCPYEVQQVIALPTILQL